MKCDGVLLAQFGRLFRRRSVGCVHYVSRLRQSDSDGFANAPTGSSNYGYVLVFLHEMRIPIILRLAVSPLVSPKQLPPLTQGQT